MILCDIGADASRIALFTVDGERNVCRGDCSRKRLDGNGGSCGRFVVSVAAIAAAIGRGDAVFENLWIMEMMKAVFSLYTRA